MGAKRRKSSAIWLACPPAQRLQRTLLVSSGHSTLTPISLRSTPSAHDSCVVGQRLPIQSLPISLQGPSDVLSFCMDNLEFENRPLGCLPAPDFVKRAIMLGVLRRTNLLEGT